MIRKRWLPLATAGVAGLLLTAGCSGGGGGGSAPGPAATASTGAPAAPVPVAGQTLAPLPVVATRRTADGGTPLAVDLNQVQVSGQVMEVTFTVRNLAAGNAASRWQIAQFFANGIDDTAPSYATADAFTVDGVYVIDAKNAQRYLVARDAHGICVCSGNLSLTFVSPAQGAVLTGTFRAPPADVDTVDVVIPHAGAFVGVRVGR